MIVDWNAIETTWSLSVAKAIVATTAAHPEQRFYAGAFWLLHGDYSSLRAPVFGMNSEDSDPDLRWHPPDWRWSVIDAAHEPLRDLYSPLLSVDVDAATFEQFWDRHIDLLARVSRRVTAAVRSGTLALDASAVSTGFFVGIIDFSQGDEATDYLRRSVDDATLASCGILDAT